MEAGKTNDQSFSGCCFANAAFNRNRYAMLITPKKRLKRKPPIYRLALADTNRQHDVNRNNFIGT